MGFFVVVVVVERPGVLNRQRVSKCWYSENSPFYTCYFRDV